MVRLQFWNKIFGRNEHPLSNRPKETSVSAKFADLPNLLLIIHDGAPTQEDTFIQSVLKNLHILIGSDTQIATLQNHDAKSLESTLPFAIGQGTKYLKERSLQLQANPTIYEKFKLSSPSETIQGLAVALFAKPL